MDVVSYKCPNCSAGLSFDIERQNWHCQFCQGDFTLEDLKGQDAPAQDAESAKDAEMTMESPQWEEPHDHFGGDAVVFSCPSCGGRIVTEQNTAATFCVFCHNPTVLSSRLEKEYRPARMIPFKMQKDTVLKALHKLCRKRPLLPDNFREYAQKGEVSGLYVPFWLFDADIDASLTATGKHVRSWSDSNYRYTKTDTYRVERAASISFRNLPADGSKKMDDKLMDSLEPFDYTQMVDFSMHYLSGHFAESYDVDAKEASGRATPRMRGSVDRMMRGQITGYSSTVIHDFTSRTKDTRSTYVMLPVWVLMAQYGDKTYTFAMNGQTGKITGSLPLSRKRFWSFFAGITAAVSAIVFLGGMLL